MSALSRRGAFTPPVNCWIRRLADQARPVLLTLSAVAAVPVGLLAPKPAEACASCGCTLSSDAAMGYSATTGWRLSLEYDYIHQDELRSGTREVSGVPDGNELERETLNRYITAGLNYAPSPTWNVSLFVPYVVRTHSTYGEFDSTEPLPDLSSSRSSSLGDVRLIGAYQGFLPTHNLGVQLGVKLPTGHYGTAVDFNGGPLQGEPLDASLQPGTGSTDIIVGAYYYQAVSQDFDFFANGQFQSAVKHHMDEPGNDYRPGNSTTLSFGLRYERDPRWVPQLQINLLRKSRDQGALADIESTAGNVAYISPGMTVQVASKLHVFGFVQVPVYSNLYGYQLFPRYTASVGVSYAL
ncbi:MAG TPA: transporter [Steroidobacteraceae bacterium]|nr:transporter [Steroidobacteraceae bacterium]